MSIDWFTFVAQIVNFLILVGLLRYFLYGPIVRTMQEREGRVTQKLSDAEAVQADAEQKRKQLEAEMQAIEQQRDSLLEQAVQEADAERQRLVRDARNEVESRRQQWNQAFEREQRDLVSATQRQIQIISLQAAHHTISRLSDTDLQSQICRVLIRQLQSLDESARKEVQMQLEEAQGIVLVRSTKQLGEEDRQLLTSTISQTFQQGSDVRFKIDESLVCGLEIEAGGYSLRWNAADTLNQLEASVV
ncbi:MAG: F0F1 ATP synthase subunit B [Pirellulaceae bacterium]|nr:F0F1 ATP synthase subunit B [Pirellulaceae bacterium]